MKLSAVLYNGLGLCKICDKRIKEATPEDHYECLNNYNRHPERYE